MWPFGKKNSDYDGLGLALLRAGSEYQAPTVEGIYAYLQKSGQLQYRDEMTEKRILNAAAAVIVVELVLWQKNLATAGRGSMAKHDVLDHFYNYVQKLADQSFSEHRLRIDHGKAMTARLVQQAVADYPEHLTDPQTESLAYEIARTVIRLHVQWSSSNGNHIAVPTAAEDWRELSQAMEGLARSQRWIQQSLGKQIEQALK